MLRRSVLLASLSLSFTLTQSADAQCLTPDNLSGACWSPAQANLPALPGFTLPATGIVWVDCLPSQQCAQVQVGVPVPVTCGSYQAGVTVSDCSGNAIVSGLMTLDYSRTWDEDNTFASEQYQVYRFVAKIDFLQAGPTHASLTPACVAAGLSAFYYGYVDYAFDCATNDLSPAVVLFHNCDAYIHHPLSTVPGTFHPDRSFAFVAPDTPGNPFIAGIQTPPDGRTLSAVSRLTPPSTCMTSEPFLVYTSVRAAACGCTPNMTPGLQSILRFTGTGNCIGAGGLFSSFTSPRTIPSFPWVHMLTTSLGSWLGTSNYPGPERAWADEAPVLFIDEGSAATGGAGAFGEVYYGATTSDGYEQSTLTGPIEPNFLDVASNTSWAIPGPPPSTFMGSVLPTRNIVAANIESDL